MPVDGSTIKDGLARVAGSAPAVPPNVRNGIAGPSKTHRRENNGFSPVFKWPERCSSDPDWVRFVIWPHVAPCGCTPAQATPALLGARTSCYKDCKTTTFIN